MTPTRVETIGAAAPGWLVEAAQEAVGRRHRHDPPTGRSGGSAGNATLTAWLGLGLLVVLLAEAVTLLDVTGLMAWHAGLGTIIGALLVAKTASTGWRVARYYGGAPTYRRAGPPPLLFRALGPLLAVAGLATVASGITLVAIGRENSHTALFRAVGFRVDAVTVHQATFLVFVVLLGVHVLGRLLPAFARLASARRETVPGRLSRGAVLLVTLAAGVAGLAVVLPLAASW